MRPYTNTSAVDTGSSQADGVTNADSLVWVVHTSEPVASGTLTGADFVLTGITPTATPTITVASDPAATAGYEDSQFIVTVSGGFDDADASAVGLALASGSSFADIAGNLADSTADDSLNHDDTYTVDNTALGAPGVSLTNDTGNTAGHTSDGAVTVTPAGRVLRDSLR